MYVMCCQGTTHRRDAMRPLLPDYDAFPLHCGWYNGIWTENDNS